MSTSNMTSVWKMKDSELKQELLDRKITEPNPWNRTDAIALVKMDIESKMAGVDEEGHVIEDPLKDIPKLELVKVIFHAQSEQSLPYVPVGHNGKAFYIPVEVEVEVPKYILNSCIKDAVEERMFPEVGVDGKINWRKKKVQRYPYTIIE